MGYIPTTSSNRQCHTKNMFKHKTRDCTMIESMLGVYIPRLAKKKCSEMQLVNLLQLRLAEGFTHPRYWI